MARRYRRAASSRLSLRPASISPSAAKDQIICFEILGRLAQRAFDLSYANLGFDGTDDTDRHPILKLEYVRQIALEAIGPEMRAGRRIDKLASDAHAGPSLADAALQYVANPKFLGRPGERQATCPCRRSSNCGRSRRMRYARQRGDDVLDHPIGKIFLLGIAAHVLEWQHGDRRLVRQRQSL